MPGLRPPNVQKCFPNSSAMLVSGRWIDWGMKKVGAMAMAANFRNLFVARGVLKAANDIDAAFIAEIARSEGGTEAYCPVNFWNIGRVVDTFCNEMGIEVPIAVHADHFGIKKWDDVDPAKVELETIFKAGMTSVAIDASHMPNDLNLLASIELAKYVPEWAALETEVGEIKGKLGLSTEKEALFLIQGLNAHDIFPIWIALNNGTTHGIEDGSGGIDVVLTKEIHEALASYDVSGAQHGTSGNSSEKLLEIKEKTKTTKANVATALQMISYGIAVDKYGNAILKNGALVKAKGCGVSAKLWDKMRAYADKNGIEGGGFKKLNIVFQNSMSAEPFRIQKRMVEGVREFAREMMKLFGMADTGSLILDQMGSIGSVYPERKVARIEDKKDWTPEKIKEKAALIDSDKGPDGKFED